ncbi:hypothetical protein AAE02nite_21570 [Adhaeribacter aerolatus]|uniref:Uncharacterized protein n=1 Tax=Adhaeribacter aerolatus TaxID=670289 RepID=A0A512AXQ6_9BACT|nr:hypothetical protein [Adhaeribacter aerolatus]GEO04493.1 hypothetical protein AAE02nite_21570 [Adhaeribacter aerolatus]
MDLYQFNFQNYENREALVWQYGSFICFREEDDFRIVLYHMGSFFAEVWYHVPDNQIELVRGFKSRKALEPYLVTVDLSDLER